MHFGGINMRYIMALLLSLALATPVLAAGFEGPGAKPDTQPPARPHPAGVMPGAAAGGGFKGPGVQPAITKAAQVRQAQDDTPVVLEGKIVEKIPSRKNRYVFQDDSGKVVVDINRKQFRGQTVTPQDRVRLHGHVDSNRKKDNKVEVDHLEVLK